MKYRCDNVNNSSYINYGARGITYTPKWKTFSGFLDDMEQSWEDGLTLDRIDVNGPYCKENCRWTDRKQQAINRRNTKLFKHKGQQKTLTDWSDELGIKRSTLAQRIYVYGWSVERALTNP